MPEGTTTRASLLTRTKDLGDTAAWQEFDRRYRKMILAVALKRGLTREEAEDVAQETMRSVAAALPGFEYDPRRCHFRTWLQTLIRRRIADHYRHRARPLPPPRDDVGAPMDWAADVEDPDGNRLEALWDAEWEQSILETAWNRLKQAVKPLQFQVLHLRLREERSFSEIARALDLSLNNVYLSRMRAGRVLQRLVREARREADLRDERVIRTTGWARSGGPDRSRS